MDLDEIHAGKYKPADQGDFLEFQAEFERRSRCEQFNMFFCPVFVVKRRLEIEDESVDPKRVVSTLIDALRFHAKYYLITSFTYRLRRLIHCVHRIQRYFRSRLRASQKLIAAKVDWWEKEEAERRAKAIAAASPADKKKPGQRRASQPSDKAEEKVVGGNLALYFIDRDDKVRIVKLLYQNARYEYNTRLHDWYTALVPLRARLAEARAQLLAASKAAARLGLGGLGVKANQGADLVLVSSPVKRNANVSIEKYTKAVQEASGAVATQLMCLPKFRPFSHAVFATFVKAFQDPPSHLGFIRGISVSVAVPPSGSIPSPSPSPSAANSPATSRRGSGVGAAGGVPRRDSVTAVLSPVGVPRRDSVAAVLSPVRKSDGSEFNSLPPTSSRKASKVFIPEQSVPSPRASENLRSSVQKPLAALVGAKVPPPVEGKPFLASSIDHASPRLVLHALPKPSTLREVPVVASPPAPCESDNCLNGDFGELLASCDDGGRGNSAAQPQPAMHKHAKVHSISPMHKAARRASMAAVFTGLVSHDSSMSLSHSGPSPTRRKSVAVLIDTAHDAVFVRKPPTLPALGPPVARK